MVDDYGYINARIRALRSRLLTADALERLLSQPDLDHLLMALRETPYGEDLSRVDGTLPPAERIHRALHRNLARTYRKILMFSAGKPRTQMQVVTGRYDVHNVLAILRGKAQGLGDTEIRNSLLPAGVLDDVRLEELLRRNEPREVLEVLGTWNLPLPFSLSRGLFRALEQHNLQQVEVLLYESYLAWARIRLSDRDENDRVVLHTLQAWVDMRNLMAALLLIKDGIKPAGRVIWLPGGHLAPRKLRALEDLTSLEDVRAALQGTPYAALLPRTLTALDLPAVERRLEERAVREALRARKGDPLGIGIALSYFAAKDTEITNLRMITYGIAFGLDRKEILPHLILPEELAVA